MINPWLPILQSLTLSRTEREVVRRFENEPDGRSFLPVADILRAHQLHDEALELLTYGVERHPSFTVARVFLARDLLQKGLVEASWRTLQESPVPLKDNLLAQKLSVRVGLLMGLEPQVRQTLSLIKINQGWDVETKRIADTIELVGFAAARQKLIAELKDRGTNLTLPTAPSLEKSETSNLASANLGTANRAAAQDDITLESSQIHEQRAFDSSASSLRSSVKDYNMPDYHQASLKPVFLDEHSLQDKEVLSAFHVVPLDEIFRPDASNIPQAVAGFQSGGVELDSTTLADIYERQGHYTKALAIYRRLLRVTPNSDLYRRKVAELVKLEKEQRDVELTVDPALVDRLESVEIIDRQIRFYNQLLSRLI